MSQKLISPKRVLELVKSSKIILIDVRPHAQYEASHIKSSFNVPLEELEEHKNQLSKLKERVVIVCRSGNKAGIACSKLSELGMDNLEVLEGGMLNWESKNYNVIKGKQMWDIERQVRLIAGFLVFLNVILGFIFSDIFFIISGFIGTGLMFASITNSCIMGLIIAKMPHNKIGDKPKTNDIVKKILNV